MPTPSISVINVKLDVDQLWNETEKQTWQELAEFTLNGW